MRISSKPSILTFIDWAVVVASLVMSSFESVDSNSQRSHLRSFNLNHLVIIP